MACKMPRARVDPGAFPPSERLDVMAMATRKPATYYCPATRWSLDDLVAALCQRQTWTMSRSSIWRILEEAELTPHRSVYWLNSHAPDFEANAHDSCSLYLNAHRFFAQGRLVICSDEKTGMQILERNAQFISICRWLQLIYKDRLAPLENAPFSTPRTRKRYSVV